MYPPSRNSKVKFRPQWGVPDLVFLLILFLVILAIIKTASNFGGHYDTNLVEIETTPNVLPAYAAQTLLRMVSAYIVSLVFTLVYAYSAYRSRAAEMILIPLLDILQSIPVLSFLPGVVLALIALFPGQRIGVELASIVLIFTGMTWNMTFSFYQSLRSIPRELKEAASIYRLNLWQRFWNLELPVGVIGLVWNSVMSVAGGWFFLMAIESFTLGEQKFNLPGLGSYLAKAADKGDYGAIGWGLAVLIGIIIAIDFFIWRPLISWAEKFKMEMVEAQNTPQSSVLDFLRRSPTLRVLSDKLFKPLQKNMDHVFIEAFPLRAGSTKSAEFEWGKWLTYVCLFGFGILVFWGMGEAWQMLQTLNLQNWQTIVLSAIITALRVIIALILSLAWTVPVGVSIGRNPKLSQLLQPIVQIAASVPATALFPPLLLLLIKVGGGLEIGSVALMMLGTMWYILFNVIAGAQSIPEDLLEAARIYKLSLWQRWETIILPGIFPYLITGIITAVGGAWNASIVSEYVNFQGQTIAAPGLGALISEATAKGNFDVLLASTMVMSFLVVLTNRLVWRPLYRLAQEKYQLLL